jgi:hypothetical protein
MTRIRWLAIALLLFVMARSPSVQAQTVLARDTANVMLNAATATGAGTSYAVPKTSPNSGDPKSSFTWYTVVTGAPSAVSDEIDCSPDNSHWNAVSTNTTAGGNITSVYAACLYLRANLTVLTGGTTPTITVFLTFGEPSAAIGSSGGGFTAGGDLSGTSSSQTVVGIKGVSVPTLAIGYLYFNGSAFVWQTTAQVYPGAGIPISTGSAWGTSLAEANGSFIEGVSGAWTVVSSIPIGSVGTAGLSGTPPIAISAAGAISVGTATTGALGVMEVGTGLSVSSGVVTPTFGTAANQVAQGGVITAGGPTGGANSIPVLTYNAAGQLTVVTTATPSIPATEITGQIAAGNGGTGIANTATLTLGSSNRNYATLGTGIEKNTTTTGAVTDAVASDVYGLFTSCTGSSGLFLEDGGTCAAPSGGAPNFPVNAKSGTYQVLASDFAACKTIPVASGTFTITLVASTSQPANGQCIWILNYGTGTVTVATSGQNLNGSSASQSLAPAPGVNIPNSMFVFSDGGNYFDITTVGSSAEVSVTGDLIAGRGVTVDNGSNGNRNLTFATVGDHIITSSSCTTTPNDICGVLTVSSSTTSNTKTFTTSYTSAPTCVLQPTSDSTAVGAYWPTVTATTIVANVKISGSIVFNYYCMR